MAQREYKWRVTANRDGWERLNPVTEKIEATFVLPDNETTRHNLLLVGFKSTLSDKSALPAGAGASARDGAMRKMYEAIRTGVWAFRDGRGGGAVKVPDASIYMALVAVGKLTDSDAARKAWAAVNPATRLGYAADPAVAAYIAANQPSAEEAADTLADLIRST